METSVGDAEARLGAALAKFDEASIGVTSVDDFVAEIERLSHVDEALMESDRALGASVAVEDTAYADESDE